MNEDNMTNFILGAMFTINLSLVGVIYYSLSNRVSKIETLLGELALLVSGKYILRDEALANNNRVLDKLDTIQLSITTCMSKHNRRRGDVEAE